MEMGDYQMKLLGAFVALSILGVITTPSLGQTIKWVDASPGRASCLQTCQDNGGDTPIAVRGGKFPTGAQYFVCTAEAAGERPGFSIPDGEYANLCDISWDGQGQARPISKCLCADKVVAAQ